MDSFKLAMAQMLVTGGRGDANLARAERFIAEAAAAGAQLIVLPEALNFGWTHPSARHEADTIPAGAHGERLARAARHNRIYVCAGLIERAADKLFNSAILLNPDGKLILHHRKINELEIAHDLYSPGDRLSVAQTPLGTLGVMICADAFAGHQSVSRTLGMMGAELILSPCAWAVPFSHNQDQETYGQLWRDNYIPVARDFRLWIAGVSNVGWIVEGPWAGRPCIGSSLLIDPAGQEVLRGPYGPAAEMLLFSEIKLHARPAHGTGWERLRQEEAHGEK